MRVWVVVVSWAVGKAMVSCISAGSLALVHDCRDDMEFEFFAFDSAGDDLLGVDAEDAARG